MVNTFVISSCVVECARALDYKRLGKQRVEARQIFSALTVPTTSKSWKNHPATLAWVGHENALNEYTNAMIREWIARGYNNTMEMFTVTQPVSWPWWFDWEVLHNTHKASLNRKEPSYYNFDIPPIYANHGYIWPSKVPVHLRKVSNPDLNEICAPISKPPNYKKKANKLNDLEIVDDDVTMSKQSSNANRKRKATKVDMGNSVPEAVSSIVSSDTINTITANKSRVFKSTLDPQPQVQSLQQQQQQQQQQDHTIVPVRRSPRNNKTSSNNNITTTVDNTKTFLLL